MKGIFWGDFFLKVNLSNFEDKKQKNTKTAYKDEQKSEIIEDMSKKEKIGRFFLKKIFFFFFFFFKKYFFFLKLNDFIHFL